MAASQPLTAPVSMTLSEVASALGLPLQAETSVSEKPLDGLTTDSRAVRPGGLFVAMSGDRFDGHDFVETAIAAGAAAVLVEKGRGPAVSSVPVLEVADTLQALGDLAHAWRCRFHIPVIAITGSNGKTTTKEITKAIFAEALGAEAVLATLGNFNNLIGMPLTALALNAQHRASIFEMGMNAPGEIARMTAIAEPTVGLITCVAEAHLEGLGSIEGVALAKGELFAGLRSGAVAVVNTDDPQVLSQVERHEGPVLRFGREGAVRAENIELDGFGASRFDLVYDAQSVAVALPLGGRHNVWNAVGAAAAAIAAGLELDVIARGLAKVEAPPMRLRAESLANGILMVNDAYNANPGSVAASIGVLAEAFGGRNVIVLGDMRELGERAPALHEEVGRKAAAATPRLLATLGEFSEDILRGAREAGLDGAQLFAGATHEEVALRVAEVWREGDAVLVKGSRGSEMERVTEELERIARQT